MLKHYLKVAFRNLSRSKVFSFINILGLAVGMGVCLLIYQYIHFELSYDRFHENTENIYRLAQTNIKQKSKGAAGVGFALAPACAASIPEIKNYVRVHPQWRNGVIVNPTLNVPFEENDVLYVDDNFLTVFNFPLVYGDPYSALTSDENIVITERMALKYFGKLAPIGERLRLTNERGEKTLIVSGVLAPIPTNSQLQFDFLLPVNIIAKTEPYNSFIGSWGYTNFTTYMTLTEDANLDQVSKKIARIEAETIGDMLARFNVEFKTTFQPLLDVHLKSDWRNDMIENHGSLEEVYLFGLIAVFVLFMAWINSVNLSTARAMQRVKEVGVRKSIGAFKRQLITQFLVEAFLVNLIAAGVAIGLTVILLPMLSEILGKVIELTILTDPLFWVGFFTLLIFGTLGSGLYPAFVLSSTRTLNMLHDPGSINGGGLNLRRGLIVFQFLISALLISGAFLVYQQINYMKEKELGIDMEKILVVKGSMADMDNPDSDLKFQTFKNQITSHHSIQSMTTSGSVPGRGFDFGTQVHRPGADKSSREPAYFVFADIDFTNTYNFTLLAGRLFSNDLYSDEEGVLINETAVEAFKLRTPEDAIDQSLIVKGEVNDTVKVIGVLADFHWLSLKDAHDPYLISLDNRSSAFYSFKLSLSDLPASLSHVESVFRNTFPDSPFNYFFLDDDFNRQYKADLQFGDLFATLSGLAIFIACIGLFALVSFSATLRKKEIGIRKVLGAGIGHLMGLLSREYLLLLLSANVIAFPVILHFGQNWLDNYAFKIEMGIDLLLIPGAVLIIISLITVSYKTYSTAKANPVDSLRSE